MRTLTMTRTTLTEANTAWAGVTLDISFARFRACMAASNAIDAVFGPHHGRNFLTIGNRGIWEEPDAMQVTRKNPEVSGHFVVTPRGAGCSTHFTVGITRV